MPIHLLDLPTEIISQILAPLPTSSLLRFSETSHHARTLANANLHTLSLGIAPPTLSRPKLLNIDQTSEPTSTTSNSTKSPYSIWLQISKAQTYEYWTLFNFQSALVTSILKRHGTMLQHLEISVWALTLPMVSAIENLRALRRFSLRIERIIGGRRSCVAVKREEQEKAWELLTKSTPVWSRRLMALKLENCDLKVDQLAILLKESRDCEELGLDRCRYFGKGLWTWLMEWEGTGKLKVLNVADCGGQLGDVSRMAMGKLNGLQVRPCSNSPPSFEGLGNRVCMHANVEVVSESLRLPGTRAWRLRAV